MSLTGKQYTECYFWELFLKRAINGDEAYIDIVKPIILDAAKCARKEISIFQLDREACSIKLYMLKIPALKKAAESNLKIPEIRDYLIKHWEEFCQSIDN